MGVLNKRGAPVLRDKGWAIKALSTYCYTLNFNYLRRQVKFIMTIMRTIQIKPTRTTISIADTCVRNWEPTKGQFKRSFVQKMKKLKC